MGQRLVEMLGLDIIGAGERLAAYTVMARVRSIDPEKLRRTITDKAWGGVIPGAITVADEIPSAALDIVLPIAQAELAKIGITADLSRTEKPPKAAGRRETAILLGVGAVGGIILVFAGRFLYRLIKPAR